jgi:hypothetical protein
MATNYNYFGGIVTNGLVLDLDAAKVASYPGTGTSWYDISGNNNNGTLTNGPTFSGIGKQASIVFDGVDDYVGGTGIDAASTALGGSRGVTISMWVKRTILSSGTPRTFFGFSNTSLSHKLLLSFTTDNLIQVFGRSATETGQSVITTTSFTSTSDWYNVTGVWIYGTNTILCYVNSILQPTTGTVTFSQSTLQAGTSANLNRIGSELASSTLFPGNIASTQIYNRALSADEVSQNFNALRGRYGI